jgi:hypothetical protein
LSGRRDILPIIYLLLREGLVCKLLNDGIFVTFLTPVGHFDLNLLITIPIFFAIFIDLFVDLIKDKVWGRYISGGLLKEVTLSQRVNLRTIEVVSIWTLKVGICRP